MNGPPSGQFNQFNPTNSFPPFAAPVPTRNPMLKTIQESTFEHSESFDSSQASHPASPVKNSVSFDFVAPRPQNDVTSPFMAMNSMPPTPTQPGIDANDSTLRRDSVSSVGGHSTNNTSNNINSNWAPTFQPQQSAYDNSAPFDFMSSGQVTSIPTFDPISLDDTPKSNQAN